MQGTERRFLLFFDFPILNFIQSNIRNDFLDQVVPFITALGNFGLIWILLAVVLIAIPKTRKTGIIMAVAMAAEALCNLALKPVFARVRPCYVNTAVEMLIARPLDYSFPSGHAGASFAAAMTLFFRRKKDGNKIWIPAVVLAVLISLSRLYLYVHYPSDVIAGALLGTFFGYLSCRIFERAENRQHVKDAPEHAAQERLAPAPERTSQERISGKSVTHD